MDNFYVAGSNQSFPASPTGDILAPGYQLCGRYPGTPPVGEISRVTCQPHPITTRYVYIQVDGRGSDSTLELCEVWVYGSKCNNFLVHVKAPVYLFSSFKYIMHTRKDAKDRL